MASLVLKENREKSLLRNHPWVFDGAIEEEIGTPRSGATVDILSSSGKWLAKAAYSPHSQIRARVWSFNQDTIIDNNFFTQCIKNAISKRKAWLQKQRTNAYRIVAAESDGLPGITIDLYGDVLVIQLLSAGADKHRDKIVHSLKKIFPDYVIHERSDVAVRKKEGLEQYIETHVGVLPNTVIIQENGLKIEVDLINGHKTGFYLDQRKNRKIAGRLCRDKKVLNCFSYTGTFGLSAALNGAKSVVNLDVSESAIDTSLHNVQLNSDVLNEASITHLMVDVFEQLRVYKENKTRFDVIILDPPKFVENKNHLVRAARGYKDINRLACELLNENGCLITFSCSGLMREDLFSKIVADAAQDAGVYLSVQDRLHQDCDHTVASYFPEGHYLKGLVCIKSKFI
ncbi:class I SAM-dependent rRNA methyltransferase [Glaciecola petra]|uniref:Class I SAM-dependent methyltransferase n=1 Tax=Glaciecola petra TaxID=3075602 RepID=A0ABU2ZP75_9ALTE|nr:class I SAM-dependent methyltransferase [Aestuariibacter sp. P117]MDT0594200.1 class I SAM-dependent methyltransferase [Aestuariibacter sp. P117]